MNNHQKHFGRMSAQLEPAAYTVPISVDVWSLRFAPLPPLLYLAPQPQPPPQPTPTAALVTEDQADQKTVGVNGTSLSTLPTAAAEIVDTAPIVKQMATIEIQTDPMAPSLAEGRDREVVTVAAAAAAAAEAAAAVAQAAAAQLTAASTAASAAQSAPPTPAPPTPPSPRAVPLDEPKPPRLHFVNMAQPLPRRKPCRGRLQGPEFWPSEPATYAR